MRAYAHLYRPYNDFDVYVEDGSYVGVYERIINRALKGKGRVTRVIPLGPKNEVIKAAINDNDDGRRKIYIVDSDLDLISKARVQKVRNVHRLGVYSLENLVFEKDAVEQYLTFSQPGRSLDRCKLAYNYEKFENDLGSMLGMYLIALGVAWRLNLRGNAFSIDSKSVSKIDRGHYVGPDARSVKLKTLTVIKAIKEQSSKSDYRSAKKVVVEIIKRRNISAKKFIPGKKFLIGYLNGSVAASGGNAHQQQAIVSYLADRCNLEFDKKLARKLRSLARF